ncbi:Redoxin-domain-containing protein [Xylogone sp. PMI_703]|nr:Redoxin-domain-containing protein [Xylogone sp. PMI_703]
MASAASLRKLAFAVPRSGLSRSFQSSARAFIQAGDKLPANLPVLTEDSPGNKIDLAETVNNGKALIIGVPAAFSPGCSNSHIPGYINHKKLKDAGDVFVVSVNDAFVMKAWADALDPTRASGIRFLGDPTAKFTEALDLTFDGSAIFGGPRSKRYALEVEDGKVKAVHVEPDNTGLAGICLFTH